MRLYLVEWMESDGYDRWSDFIIACSTPTEARNTHPDGRVNAGWDGLQVRRESWIEYAKRDQLKVTYLGRAKKDFPACVLIASYHAGDDK